MLELGYRGIWTSPADGGSLPPAALVESGSGPAGGAGLSLRVEELELRCGAGARGGARLKAPTEGTRGRPRRVSHALPFGRKAV